MDETTTDIAAKLAELSPQQRRELLLRLAEKRQREGLHPVHGDRVVRASVQQEQLWFIDGYDEASAANNLIYKWTFRGELDEDRLRAAFARVVSQNESLRTHFVEANALEIRLLEGGHTLPPTKDGSADPAALIDEELRSARATRFRLSEGPLFRATLLRLSEREHMLVFVVHHIVWDAASVPSFVGKLRAEYLSSRPGDRVPDEKGSSSVDYRSYSVWQRAELESRGHALRAEWKEQLADAPLTELSSDKPRPSRQTFSGVSHDTTLIAGEQWELLRDAAAADGATPYSASLAMFAYVLASWTRQDEVLIGSPVDLRTDEKLRDSIGYYVNMLPLRISVVPTATIAEHVAGVRNSVSKALDLRELPFADIVAAVNPRRDPSRSPLVQIEFAYEALGELPNDWDGLELSHGKVHDGGSRFDISVIVRETSGGLDVSVEYNPDLYEPETIDSLTASFALTLREAARSFEQKLGLLPLVEDPRLMAVMGKEPIRPPVAAPVIDRILELTVTRPDTVAIVEDSGSVTYGALGHRIRSTAAWLRKRAVAPGDRVLIAAPQSADAIVAILATHAVGATYVPFDLTWPQERQNTVAEVADARVILKESDAPTDIEILRSEGTIRDTWLDSVDLASSASLEQDAYLLFTSGTTGQPKGVVVGQTALAHFTNQICAEYGITENDVVLAFARLTFDVSVFEIFSALWAGATVAIPSSEQRLDPVQLMSFMLRHQVSVAEIPPALMPQLTPAMLPDLRLVSVGGEAFDGTLVDSWVAGGREFWNGYGPTEATVAVTLYRCERSCTGNPPIGRPIGGVTALLVDPLLRVLPQGAVGELLLAGPSLANGYFRNRAATESAFINLQLGGADRTFYRTGDLCRWGADGQLRYLGRIDDQKKLNGFRIELAEIEGALRAAPSVADAAVTIDAVPGAGSRLIGWIESDAADGIRSALEHVSSVLPEYAVPSALSLVPRILRSPNGKIDRDKMVREYPVSASQTGGTRSLTVLERQIHDDVFSVVLKETVLDPDVPFFRLGGNSLQATQVVALIRRHFGSALTVADFFSSSSIAAMAATITRQRGAAQ